MRPAVRPAAAVLLTLVLAAVLARPAVVRAEPASEPTGRRAIVDLAPQARVPTALDSIPHPWPGRALALSAAGTVLPVALMAGASDAADSRVVALMALEIVTPAAGHLYGGLTRRALIGMGVRATGFAMAAKALSDDSSEFDWNVVLALGGIALTGLSAVVDVVTVANDVERANRERVAAPVSLAPRLTPSGRAPALALTARF